MALQSKTYTLGSFDRENGSSNGYLLELILTEESVNAAANLSQIRYQLQLRSGPSNRFNWELTAALSLGGVQAATVTAEHFLDYNDTWVLLSGQQEVPHNPDGTLNMAFSAAVTPWNGGNQYTPPALTLTGTVQLTAIARASGMVATSACIGDAATIVISRKDPAYTHTIRYDFGSLCGYLSDAAGTVSAQAVKLTDTTILFALPESFYQQIPNSPAGSCKLTCTTYQGDTQVGQPQVVSITVTADPQRCAPLLTGTAEDVNPVTLLATGDPSVIVRGYSHVRCTAQAQAQKGARLVSLTVNGQPITADSLTLSRVQTATITFRAGDSRGYTAEFTVPGLSLVDYTGLSATVTARRLNPTDGTARIEIYGNYFPGNFGAYTNQLYIRYAASDGNWIVMDPDTDGVAFRAIAQLTGQDYRQSHTFQVQIEDELQKITKSVTLQPGVPVFDWGQADFAFHVPVRFTASDGRVFTLDLQGDQLTAIME